MRIQKFSPAEGGRGPISLLRRSFHRGGTLQELRQHPLVLRGALPLVRALRVALHVHRADVRSADQGLGRLFAVFQGRFKCFEGVLFRALARSLERAMEMRRADAARIRAVNIRQPFFSRYCDSNNVTDTLQGHAALNLQLETDAPRSSPYPFFRCPYHHHHHRPYCSSCELRTSN